MEQVLCEAGFHCASQGIGTGGMAEFKKPGIE